MRRIRVARALLVMAITLGALVASASCAYGSRLDLSAPFTAPVSLPPVTPPGYVSPLLAEEVGVLTAEGIPAARAMRAIEVQGAVAHSELPKKLHAAMGSAYAGVWFEATTAKLHVGVTSPASRQVADAVIRQAGLTDDVMVTQVRSTFAQLVAVQNQWDGKHVGLFAREETQTALEPQHNGVAVTLTAAVPAQERAALKREAAAAPANVLVTVAPSQRLGFTSDAKECSNYPEADCNPSITPGVLIWPKPTCVKGASTKGVEFFKTEKECKEEKVSGTEGEWKREQAITEEEEEEGLRPSGCTAGPVAIPVKKRTVRVLLTAGHCIETAGGEKVEWYALTREFAELLIGKARTFQNGGAMGAQKGDFGEILIESIGGWETGKPNVPVLAVTAEWKKAQETRYRVKGIREAVPGNTNCHEGKTSGEWCGKIKAVNVKALTRPPRVANWKEGFVEDEKAPSEAGDSGGPWLFIEANNEVLMEGSHSAKVAPTCEGPVAEGTGTDYFLTQTECLNWRTFKQGTHGTWKRKVPTYFFPLKAVEGSATLGSLEILNLEPLTTANERIRPEFVASKFPVKFTATTGADTLETIGGRSVKCKESKGEGELSSAEEVKNTVIKFTGCKGKIGTLEGPCKSTGAAAEEIVTGKLKGSPVYIKESSKEVGLVLSPQEAEGLYAEFKCESLLTETVKVKGSSVAPLTPINTSTKSYSATAKEEKGKSIPSEYENNNGEEVKATTETKGEGVVAFGYEDSGLEGTLSITTAEAVEVVA